MFADRIRRMRVEKLLQRAIDGVGQIAMHEAGAIDNHLFALREHVAVARKARGVGELLRDQIDLLPASRNRLVADHRRRLRLWHELRRQLIG